MALEFSNLRRLSTRHVYVKEPLLLEALVQDNLCYLDICMSECPVFQQFLRRRGLVRSLRTFVWSGNWLIHPPIAFLQENPQITTLALPTSISSTTLKTEIIPILSKSFQNLSPLYLVWRDVLIPDSDLQMISHIKTLKQLHLRAGDQFGEWMIDHGSLRHYLCSLPLLEKLAFSRESYHAPGEDPGRIQEILLHEASKYASVMPRLKWMYFGAMQLAVKTNSEDGVRTAYALAPEDCGPGWSMLRKMFRCSTSYGCSN